VAHEIALSGPVPIAGATLALARSGPALPARAAVVVLGVDACRVITTTVRTTLTQAVAAGSREWTISTPLGTALPQGTVVYSQLLPLALSDLKEGDALLGPGGSSLLFGLVFEGRAPDFTLTRLLRACRESPCPLPST
jgi:hypothetical protein